MGYKDDLIARLKEEGRWDTMPVADQRYIMELSDDEARDTMVFCDSFDMGDPNTVQELKKSSMRRLCLLFDGCLIDPDQESETCPLSRAGMLLAGFFAELAEAGVPIEQARTDFEQLNNSDVVTLLMIYRELAERLSHDENDDEDD